MHYKASNLQAEATAFLTIFPSKVNESSVSLDLPKKMRLASHEVSLPRLPLRANQLASEHLRPRDLRNPNVVLPVSGSIDSEPIDRLVPGAFVTGTTIQENSEISPLNSRPYLASDFFFTLRGNATGLRESLEGDVKPNNDSSRTISENYILVDITVNATGVSLKTDGRQIYTALNHTMAWGRGRARLHAGLHLITLNQDTGQVMAADSYMTWQPTSEGQFLAALHHTQRGRLLVIAGAPDFTSSLGEATIRVLEEMGALYIDRLAYKDAWCLLVHKGGGVLLEALTTSLPLHNLTEWDVSPLTLHASVPRKTGGGCGWYGVAGLQERAAFCDTYDGYGDFCTCHHPPWSPLPQHPVEYEMKEVIPVAIVTARRLPHVLRQVGQVWASPGGTNTPITIFVDGHNPEAQALAALLHLPLVQHYDAVPRGSIKSVNNHVRFVLTKVFELYPEADKAIILEDDLDLSPDFIPYFHQTASLLETDPKLLCVNAYNYNAFNHTALDPTRLYRVHGAPAYGWMVRRNVATEMINNWVPTDQGMDWDLWVRAAIMGDRDILVPEIPRTKHRGGGGVHVTGIEQEQYYNQRPLNALLNVTLDLHGAELNNYLKLHTNNIRTGHVVHFSKHPCVELPIPRHQVNQSYVVYVDQPNELKSSSGAYYVAARCLGLDDHIFHENLQMMYTASFYGNQLYVVGCPNSPFCMTKDAEKIYRVTQEDVDYADNHPFRRIPSTQHVALRAPPLSLSDELNLTNLLHYDV
ncbi:protein O-linked-mannose beta-1,2-N-acetylglucosaminyltransferase 1 [Procambarus clarkii]|uniref:protein O-linked-mannose beta-1,2-N-acetylglucosaminyltransferase 1 n=1 Tax=Procambarus clarkii TaxID=6728 RepID=UPI003741EEB3